MRRPGSALLERSSGAPGSTPRGWSRSRRRSCSRNGLRRGRRTPCSTTPRSGSAVRPCSLLGTSLSNGSFESSADGLDRAPGRCDRRQLQRREGTHLLCRELAGRRRCRDRGDRQSVVRRLAGVAEEREAGSKGDRVGPESRVRRSRKPRGGDDEGALPAHLQPGSGRWARCRCHVGGASWR